jgi:DNA modification methylase
MGWGMMRVKDLKANPENPRKITQSKLSQLEKAMHEFGDLSGIVFNRRTGNLVSGHQRSKNFEAEAQITVVNSFKKPNLVGTVVEGYIENGGIRWNYREVDWPRNKEMAGTIAANKLAGEWDMPQLSQWMEELNSFDSDLDPELTMFDDQEMIEFGFTEETEKPRVGVAGVDEDEIPEKPEARTKPGDLYKLGNHRLLCGDSTKREDVERLMNGEKADMVFTSPPYNAAKNSFLNGRVKGFDTKYQNSDDDMTDEDFLGLLGGVTELCLEYSSYVFVNLGLLAHNRIALIEYQYAFRDRLKDILIWNKSQCPPNIVKGAFNTKWEYVFCFSVDNKTRGFPSDWRGQYPNVIEGTNNSSNEHADYHRAGFPVYFPVWVIEKMNFAKSVWDPFCGTGTTIIACEKTSRKCYGMEIDPHYCDVIVERWEKYTGAKAKLCR